MARKYRFSNDIYQEWTRLYLVEMLNSVEIAVMYNCRNRCVIDNLKRLGVKIRSFSEIRLGKYGPKANNFKGIPNIHGYTYEFNLRAHAGRKLQKLILERDNYECQDCGKPHEPGPQKFVRHHINFDKLDNRPENLVLLCVKCHMIEHTRYKNCS